MQGMIKSEMCVVLDQVTKYGITPSGIITNSNHGIAPCKKQSEVQNLG